MGRPYDPEKRRPKKKSKKGILLGGGSTYKDKRKSVSTAELF